LFSATDDPRDEEKAHGFLPGFPDKNAVYSQMSYYYSSPSIAALK
jgi:hypothetical protein